LEAAELAAEVARLQAEQDATSVAAAESAARKAREAAARKAAEEARQVAEEARVAAEERAEAEVVEARAAAAARAAEAEATVQEMQGGATVKTATQVYVLLVKHTSPTGEGEMVKAALIQAHGGGEGPFSHLTLTLIGWRGGRPLLAPNPNPNPNPNWMAGGKASSRSSTRTGRGGCR
jgi:hypothetical protein